MSSIQQEQYVLTTIQGNETLFGENAGKQCVAMSALTATIYHHIGDNYQYVASLFLSLKIICIFLEDVLSRQMIIPFKLSLMFHAFYCFNLQ